MTVTDIKVFNLDFSHSVDAFEEGTIDAFFCVAGVPTTAISELTLKHDIVLLEIDAGISPNGNLAKVTIAQETGEILGAGEQVGYDEDGHSIWEEF